ncbi:MAG: Ig-like domain-containing protein, partial [Opitutaceae bacterium]
ARPVNAGTYTVVAVPADGNYTGSATGTFTIERAPQYIVFAPLPETPLASIRTDVVLQASASSNLPVTLSLASGSLGSLSAEGKLTGIPSAGTVTVRAVQSGNANYLAAPEAGVVLDVAKKNQYVEFSPIPDLPVTSGAVELKAVSSSGLETTFSVVSGPATLNGKMITPTGAGTVVVKAVQPGDSAYNPAQERLQSFRILLLSQSLSFPALGTAIYGDAPVTLRASTDSGLPVSYAVLSGPGVVTGGTLAITAAGEIIVRATQSGNGTYAAAAPVEQVLIVAPLPLRVGVKPATRPFGAANPVFELTFDGFLSGDGVAGLESLPAVNTVAGETSPAGVYDLNLSGGRSSKYRFVFTPGQLTVVKALQTLVFESLPNQALGNAPFTLGAAASSGLPVSYQLVSGPAAVAGNQVSLNAAGRVVIRALQPGNGNFEAAVPVEQAFNVAERIEVIALNSSSKDGYYRAGQTVEISVSFSGIVNVAGTPALQLNTAAQRSATYLSGSGTSVLTFAYQVQAGDLSADLDAAGPGALIGAIASVTGAVAPSLVVPVGTAAGALARSRDIIVDTVAPPPPSFNMPLLVGTRRPVLSGQAESRSVVQVFKDGGVVATVTADAGGVWSATAATDLSEGRNEISARATDVAGNTGALSAVAVLEVDLSVPAAPVIVTSGATNVLRPVIRGTAPAGSTVTLLRSGLAIGTALTAADGSWSADPTADLPLGINRLTAVARNRAGTASAASAEANVEIDTTAPAAPVFTLSRQVIGAKVPVSGTAEPLATVVLFDGKIEIGSARAGANGQWSITPLVSLPAGQRALSAVARDAAGNTGPASPPLTVTVDPYPPVAPVLNAPQYSSSTRPLISGRAEAASTVRLYDGNKVVAEAVAAADGAWNFTPAEAWTEGPHPLTAVTVDAAGNTSGFSPLSLLIVDSVAPAAPVFTAASFAVTNPVIRGTAEPSARIRLLRSEQLVGSGSANSAGEWAIVLSVALTEGQNQISAIATDLAENASPPSNPVAITYNPLVPDAPAFARASILTSSATPLIEGTASPGLMVAVRKGDSVLGEVQADNAGRWSFRPGQALSDGLHVLTAFARSGTTNSSASGVLELRIDRTAPAAPSVQFSTPTRQTTVTFTGAAEARSYVRIYLNNDFLSGTAVPANGQWTFASVRSFPEGTYRVQATAEDEAGNVSARSAEAALVIDRTPPAAPSVSSASLQNTSRPSLAGRNEASAAIEVYRAASLIGSGSSGTDGGWALTVSAPLADGEHQLEIRAVDAAGNRSASQISVIRIDTSAPARPLFDAVLPFQNKARPEFAGTAEPGARVVLQEGSVEIGRATAGADGTWRVTAGADLADGRHSVSAIAIDEAGNRSPVTAAVSYEIDTVPPAAPAFSSTREYASARPVISGTGEVGVMVQLRRGTLLLGSASVDEAGQWAITLSIPLWRGSHSFVASTRDPAGNTSLTSTSATFTITLPAPASPTILASASTNSRRPEILGVAEPGGTVRIFDGGVLLGSAPVSGTGTWSFIPVADLSPGTRVLSATVTDSGGAVSAVSAEARLEIDVTAPAAPTIDALPATRVPSVPITGNAEAGTEVSVFDGGVLLGRVTATAGGRWTFVPPAEFSEGSHPLTAIAKDPAGNTGSSSAVVTLVVDRTPPTAPSVNAFASPTSAARPVITGRGEVGATVRMLRGAEIIGSALVNQAGEWTVTPTGALPDGTHTILFVQVDQAGNVGAAASRTLVIDTVAPGVPTVFPLNSTSATPVLRGLFDINDTVVLTVTLDGTTYSSVRGEVTFSRGTGVWECPVPVLNALRAGTYSVEVVARDGAGNASADLTAGEVLIGPRNATFTPASAKVRPVSDLALWIRVRSTTTTTVNLAELFVDPAGRDLGFTIREFSHGTTTVAGTVLTVRFSDDFSGYATAKVLVTPVGGVTDDSVLFSLNFVLDADGDGIADSDEAASGDFNGDGQPDSAQTAVATVKVANSGASNRDLMAIVVGSFAAGDPRGDRNGVVVDSGAVVRDAKTYSVEEFDAKPKDWVALSPVVQFELANALLKPDGSVELVITLPQGTQPPTKIFKFGYESASAVVKTFYAFEWDGRTGAQFIDNNGDGR